MSDVMHGVSRRKLPGRRGLLRSLLRSESGNVLAMTAAATIPMLGVIGGAVDISRIYLTKSRIQAACDSAVLAGRKAMNTATYTTQAKARADSMFNVNFQEEDYGTSATSFTSSADEEGKVSGTARTTVPMVIMDIFGAGPTEVTVQCSADIQVPNIDIVLVLDVTGSMDSKIGGKKKIDSLKEAAKDFYETLEAAMVGNTTSQIRYGLVPYDEAVNGADVFKTSPNFDKGELPLSHFADRMMVESRVANMTTWVSRWVPDPDSNSTSFTQRFDVDKEDAKRPFEAVGGSGTNIRRDDCQRYAANLSFYDNVAKEDVTLYPEGKYPGEGNGTRELYQRQGSSNWQTSEPNTGSQYTKISFSWESGPSGNSSSIGKCTRRVTYTRYIKEEGFKFTDWSYKPVEYNVGSYKNGSTLTYVTSVRPDALVSEQREYDLVELASLGAGPTRSTTWNGCIEERPTVAASNFAPIPTNAYDLNYIEGGVSDSLRWRTALPALTHDRQRKAWRENITTPNYGSPAYSCPSARMQSLNVMTKSEFNAHIDSLQPGGNTYLDVGMIWGLRLIAPQGMFAARNLTGPNGGQISRHIIFLTDGEPVSANNRYTAYGVERMEQRVTGSTGVSQATLHSRRFKALCDAQRGSVSIWAIAFGTSVTNHLSSCADPGRAFQADNTAQLKDAFRRIAKEVADLRLVE